MPGGSKRLWTWLLLGTTGVLLVARVAEPIARGFECYRTAARGERAEAQVVSAQVADLLVLTITTGPRAGEHCTADTSDDHRTELVAGETLEVVLQADRPDECILVATLENSILFLWTLVGMVVVSVLFLVLVGLLLDRSFRRPSDPDTRFDGGTPACPRCRATMREGYLPLLAPLHWREPGDPVGLPTLLTGLPGTVAWWGRPRLHAFRCASCEVVTLRYGQGGAGPTSPAP